MAEEQDVRIVAWPEDAVRVAHGAQGDLPVPVRVGFDESTARVAVANADEPFVVDMRMRISAAEPVPLCVTVCEPICATSDYTVGISIFDNPFASLRVRGETKIAPCRDRPAPVERCVDVRALSPGSEYAKPFTVQDVRFAPLGDPLGVVTWGAPAGKAKLAFPPAGIRVELPRPARDVRVTLGAYAGPELTVTVYGVGGRIGEFTESIDNETRTVAVPMGDVTAVEVRGGGNEAFLVEICMTPERL